MWKLRLRFEATLWLRAAVDYLKLSKTESMLLPWKWVSNHIKRLRFIYLFFKFHDHNFYFHSTMNPSAPQSVLCFCASELGFFCSAAKKNWKLKIASRQAILVLCRRQADYKVMWQHIARRSCSNTNPTKCVKTCQTPKNARVRDFHLPIGESEFSVRDSGCFFFFF